MSTEHQRYSPQNQMDRIARYAHLNGIEIVRTYADLGRSGLTLEGREGLANLLSDVVSGRADYNLILVYDVTRWGRFQDVDESAYYEFVCRRCNVRIEYCAEQFRNDGTTSSALLKTIKRTMAGEYSRELSDKTFAGQCRLTTLGFKAGGQPGYGLRRLLVDEHGRPKQILQRGQYKSLQTDRVLLVPGRKEELDVIKEIFKRCTEKKETPGAIARWLNARGVAFQDGKAWARHSVRDILLNPKYTGVNFYYRSTQKLHTKQRRNSPEKWILGPAAFSPIISEQQFRRATEIFAGRKRARLTKTELLDAARTVLARHGKISGKLIRQTKGVPCEQSFRNHFGGLITLYRLIGYKLPPSSNWTERRHANRQAKAAHLSWMVEQLRANGATVEYGLYGTRILVNDELTLSLRIATFRRHQHLGAYWQVGLQRSLQTDVTIIARLAPDSWEVMDYLLFPRSEVLPTILRLRSKNSSWWENYRFENLDYLFRLARRRSIRGEFKWYPRPKTLRLASAAQQTNPLSLSSEGKSAKHLSVPLLCNSAEKPDL